MLIHIEVLRIGTTESLFIELKNVNGTIKATCVQGDLSFDFAISRFDAKYIANKLLEWSNDKMEDINE